MTNLDRAPNELYRERLKRVEDAIELKVPDRIPVICDFGIFPAKYTGIPVRYAYYEPEKWAEAYKKVVLEFEPDMFRCTQFVSGRAWEILDTKVSKWPGHGSPDNHANQSVEWEFMKADEYDEFLKSPGDVIIRKILPKTAGALAGFSKLPPLTGFVFLNVGRGPIVKFADPEIWSAFESLHEAALEITRWAEVRMRLVEEMENLGFPSVYFPPVVQAPYDRISDHIRGMKGAMLDMFQRPEMLTEAMNRMMPVMLDAIKDAAVFAASLPEYRNKMMIWGPHRGADGFMSKKQFEKFYWPGLKAVILAILDAGMTPYMFWEGDITSRLEYLLELPKGKILNLFDRADIFKAKEILGGHQCIAGGMPSSLLQVGSVQDVKDRCKKLIDIVGKDGGYIMSTGCGMDEARPENIRAMIDFTKEYGYY